MAMTLAVVEELQTQEELNSREEAIVVWEDGLITFERALGRACMERDAECAETEAVR
jgi:TATA-binding protein-associated factor Taf7